MPAWDAEQLRVARNLVAIATKYAVVPPLLMLAVSLQESGLHEGAVNSADPGGSYGPFQLNLSVHPGADVTGPDPWYDYGFPELRSRWANVFANLNGDANTWSAPESRPAFVETFAPLAQGSIAWPAGLGAVRYSEALDLYERVS